METVIFAADKATDKFQRYHIIKGKTSEEIDALIKSSNEKPEYKARLYVVTDPHVIEAVLRKEEIETVNGMLDDWKESVRRLSEELSGGVRCLESQIETAFDYIKENYPTKE